MNPRADQIAQVAYAAIAVHSRVISGVKLPSWSGLSMAEKIAECSKVHWCMGHINDGPAAFWTFNRVEGSERSFDRLSLDDQERVFLYRAIVGAHLGWRK